MSEDFTTLIKRKLKEARELERNPEASKDIFTGKNREQKETPAAEDSAPEGETKH